MGSNGYKERVEKLLTLQNCLNGISTQDPYSGPEYRVLRQELMDDPLIGPRLPVGVRTCRSSVEVWRYINPLFPTYAERRAFWKSELDPLLSEMENGTGTPSTELAEMVLGSVDLPHIQTYWRKALERKSTDPEGALTAARSLIESTCKHILDEAGETYDDKGDVRALYRQTVTRLNLAPDQHSEQIIKQVLQGCQSVVEGLATMRSVLGDAHGKSAKSAKPLPIHAELGVNFAGSMCTFLLQTWDRRNGICPESK